MLQSVYNQAKQFNNFPVQVTPTFTYKKKKKTAATQRDNANVDVGIMERVFEQDENDDTSRSFTSEENGYQG